MTKKPMVKKTVSLPFQFAQPKQANQKTQQDIHRLMLQAIEYSKAQKIHEAHQTYNQVLSLDANNEQAYNARGILLAQLGNIDEAIQDFQKAIKIKSQYASAYSNLSNALISKQRYKEALEVSTKAIQLDQKNHHAYYNQAISLDRLNRKLEAIQAFEVFFQKFPQQALSFDPSALLNNKKHICDWQGLELLEKRCRDLATAVQGRLSSPFIYMNNHFVNRSDQLQIFKSYVQQNYAHLKSLPLARYAHQHRKIKVAYVSADFFQHATAHLMLELFELHGRDQFEWYAISHSPHDHSVMRQRLEKSFDHFIDVNDWSDEKVVQWMREQNIDIAIDLKGYTDQNRLGIFARRCAPVQMTYLGFPGTTAAPFMDYIIGDEWVTPYAHQSDYAERILQMPYSYQPNNRQRFLPQEACLNIEDPQYIAWRREARKNVGLPENALVLCCFNQAYKLHPKTINLWSEILKASQETVLWLLVDQQDTRERLLTYFEQQGVERQRIHFAARAEMNVYLTRYLLADLFLDSLVCNAHTTASDALWMGLPMVTCVGDTFASRVGASTLKATQLENLITHNTHEYKQLVLKLLADPAQLKAFSQHLRTQRMALPLFNTQRFRDDLEKLYLSVV